jgi:acetyl coenzyme A synthetase (ADP forming)-like protein
MPAEPRATTGGADVVLRDGSTVHVRPVRAADEPGLLAFLRGLGPRSRWLRFFSVPSERLLALTAQTQAVAHQPREFGLVATAGVVETIVAHGQYVLVGPDRAEVALAIADAYQRRGLGTLLLGQLAEAAARSGIHAFEASLLPDNHVMLEVLRDSGFALEIRRVPGEILVTLPTSLTEDARRRFEDRERVAAVNALEKFLSPRSVAVIGASRRPDAIGARIVENLVSAGFMGPVYPVNPRADDVRGLRASPTIEAIAAPVDLAVIVVPAEHVVTVAEQCARKGVPALLVISSGFAETGADGAARQDRFMHLCRATGMRVIGPNCFGVFNTDPGVRLNATFAPVPLPPAGTIGFMSQSGALGLAMMDYAASRGLGLSTFVSVGNKADVSGNDLLQYWEADPHTRVILLYLESFGNPRKFARIARRVGRTKPIVAVKSGRSAAGSRAAASHTGALVAADVTVEALFRQAGVIRTDTLEQMLDVAMLVAHQPIPRGRRVGIVTNAGGPAILCADACEAEGLEVPALTETSQARLREVLPAAASVTNPVDMIATATAEHYAAVLRIVAADPEIDAVVAIFIPPLVTRSEDVARAIVEAARDLAPAKPVLAVFMSRGVPDALRASTIQIPSYVFPEDAAIALARVCGYGQWLARPPATPPQVAARRGEAAAIVASALGRGGGWLEPGEVAALLACYGLPVIEQRVVGDAEQAALAATALGGTVALKAIAPGVVHKTEVGAVRLNLLGPDEVRREATAISAALTATGHRATGFIVQPMAAKGVELIVGVVHDPRFGPVIACGAGGTLVELVRDVAVRLAPLGLGDAAEMVRSLKSYPLLAGFRGAPACDVAAVEDALVRVSAMAEDLPEIAELDANPVIVTARGAVIVDARIRVEGVPAPPLLGDRTRP